MLDREKVIKGLKTCYCPPAKCEDCPYYDIENCNDTLCLDALSLLKKQDNCENCAIAIEDRQPVVRCKDYKYQSQNRANDEPDCSARQKEYEWEPNDWF